MGDLYNSSRHRKILALNGDMRVNIGAYGNPLIERGLYMQFAKTPTADLYSSRYNDQIKFLQSNSPSSVLENIGPISSMKLSMEEETLVVDGIPVEPSFSGSSSAYNTSRRLVQPAVEENISSFSGSKSRLIRRREVQYPTRFSIKNNFPEEVAVPETPKCAAGPPAGALKNCNPPGIKIPAQDWSPLDDGIAVSSPSQPGKTLSREDFNERVDCLLCGARTKKRLSVFAKIMDP
ncbi:hypothetical protein SAY87_027468 [Trapa incisa]|uniref:Uncharacterized protein n=2 Tax=Trapa TaxID=22665 RepID=A0AAN7MHP8_TRANT|nr:hypothetical protein SAY87_027468 [Trapa incisa]KAK4799282.1 hypothetical protein SAY86_024647 [Trapa natans]